MTFNAILTVHLHFRAKKMDELAALSPEEAANWLPEETNRCRFLLKCCFYTHTAASPGMPGGMAVVDTLFRTAAHSAPVPVASCFVLHILFSVSISVFCSWALQKPGDFSTVFMATFCNFFQSFLTLAQSPPSFRSPASTCRRRPASPKPCPASRPCLTWIGTLN